MSLLRLIVNLCLLNHPLIELFNIFAFENIVIKMIKSINRIGLFNNWSKRISRNKNTKLSNFSNKIRIGTAITIIKSSNKICISILIELDWVIFKFHKSLNINWFQWFSIGFLINPNLTNILLNVNI